MCEYYTGQLPRLEPIDPVGNERISSSYTWEEKGIIQKWVLLISEIVWLSFGEALETVFRSFACFLLNG